MKRCPRLRSFSWPLAIGAIVVSVLGAAQAEETAELVAMKRGGPEQLSPESIISQYKNTTDKPPAFGHYLKWSTDALLMGNGDMGLSVGGEAESLRFWINKNDFWRLQNQHLGAQPKLFGWIDIKASRMQGATYKIEQPIYNPITHGTFTKDGATLEFRARVWAMIQRKSFDIWKLGRNRKRPMA